MKFLEKIKPSYIYIPLGFCVLNLTCIAVLMFLAISYTVPTAFMVFLLMLALIVNGVSVFVNATKVYENWGK